MSGGWPCFLRTFESEAEKGKEGKVGTTPGSGMREGARAHHQSQRCPQACLRFLPGITPGRASHC